MHNDTYRYSVLVIYKPSISITIQSIINQLNPQRATRAHEKPPHPHPSATIRVQTQIPSFLVGRQRRRWRRRMLPLRIRCNCIHKQITQSSSPCVVYLSKHLPPLSHNKQQRNAPQRRHIKCWASQSINHSKILTKPHTGKEKPHPSTATEGSNPCVTKCRRLGGLRMSRDST